MAQVYITLKIMPESPDVDLSKIEQDARAKIQAFGGKIHKTEQQPVAFGLKSLNIIFMMDEAKGSTEPLEVELTNLNHIQSVEVTDVRRAFG